MHRLKYLIILALLGAVLGCSVLAHNGLERLNIGKLPTKSAPDGTVKVEHAVYKGEKGKNLRYKSENLVTGELVMITGNTKDGYRKMEYSDKSDLAVEKYFFPNGSLKSVRQCYIGFTYPYDSRLYESRLYESLLKESKMMRTKPIFYIGISREYNIDGKLIKETDYDEHFKFTLDKVKELLSEKYGIDFSGPGKFAGIARYIENGVGRWRLNIPPYIIEKREKGLRLGIDGRSGKIISQEEYDIKTSFP